jgi:hypothetical protein
MNEKKMELFWEIASKTDDSVYIPVQSYGVVLEGEDAVAKVIRNLMFTWSKNKFIPYTNGEYLAMLPWHNVAKVEFYPREVI